MQTSLANLFFQAKNLLLRAAAPRTKHDHKLLGLLTLALIMLLSPSTASAQCASGWVAGAGIPGLDQIPYVLTTWDRDGSGPLPPVVVAGGQFTTAGGVAASKIAMWDPATGVWSPLGSGMNDYVLSLAVMPNGDLVAGGTFSIAGGVPALGIARWNGSTWSAMGINTDFRDVYALAVMPNGDLVAGGTFYFANWVQVNFVARWDGSTWWPMDVGMSDYIMSLAVMPNGDLIAGGYFDKAGGINVNHIARWNGSAWSPLATGMDGFVFSLAVMPNGHLVAGGGFQNASSVPASKVARWNGSSWFPVGSGMDFDVRALSVIGASGDLVAGGQFNHAGGVSASKIARWNGSAWSALGSGMDSDVRSLAVLPSGDFVAGGNFSAAGNMPANRFALHGAGAIPTTYCTAKVNSLGCSPAMASTGIPSASSASGFVIRGSSVINNKSGLLFYGVGGPASVPFQGGTLCVAAPIKRTSAVNSGGNPPPMDCSGVFQIDMNAFASGALGGNPLPALRVPGTMVHAQWWGRDPGFFAPNATTLSNGLQYVVCM